MPDCLEYIELQERLIEIDNDILSKANLLSIKNLQLTAKESELSNIDSQISFKENQIIDIQEQINIKDQSLLSIQKQILDLNYNPELSIIYTIRKQQLTRDLASLQTLINSFSNQTRSVYCADLSEELTGDIGLCDVPGEGGAIFIHPGYGGSAVYSRTRDGIIYPVAGTNDVYRGIYNLVSMAATRKLKPIYRSGTITSVNKETNIASVSLDAAIMGIWQQIDVNQSTSLSNISISYMDCDAAIFEIGDNVLIKFSPHLWENPTIIGFAEQPKPCCSIEICNAAILTAPVNITEGSTGNLSLDIPGCKPFSWSVIGTENWALSQEITEEPLNTVTAGCGDAEIYANPDGCTNNISAVIIGDECTCTDQECIDFAIDEWPETLFKGQTASLAVLGGCAPYTWDVSGTGWELSSKVTISPVNVLTGGCGTGTITVKCSCDVLSHEVRSADFGTWVFDGYLCRLGGAADTLGVDYLSIDFVLEKTAGGTSQTHYMMTYGFWEYVPDPPLEGNCDAARDPADELEFPEITTTPCTSCLTWGGNPETIPESLPFLCSWGYHEINDTYPKRFHCLYTGTDIYGGNLFVKTSNAIVASKWVDESGCA